MVLDSALADTKIRGDILVGLAREDPLHDLALSRGQSRDVVGRGLPPGEQLADQRVHLTEQNRFSGESVSQLDSCQLAFVARER
jgi:hypothetical protein